MDSPLASVEINEAVARFVTSVTIRDISDLEFGRYEESIIRACRKNLSGSQLEHEIKRAAMKYVASFLELNERAKILARDVYEIADRYSTDDGLKQCRICGKRLPIALFRQRASGSYETACWDCEREEKRQYQAGRPRIRACYTV
jgi:hypothetical protein